MMLIGACNLMLSPIHVFRYCSDMCCHGPHSYEEWWIGPANGDVRDMKNWRRSHKDTHAVSHDIWLMAQPVTTETQHVWVDSGNVFALDLYRLAGIYSPGNGEISTPAFAMPATKLWLNAEALWEGGNYVGGADEGRQAYIMVALHEVILTLGLILTTFLGISYTMCPGMRRGALSFSPTFLLC